MATQIIIHKQLILFVQNINWCQRKQKRKMRFSQQFSLAMVLHSCGCWHDDVIKNIFRVTGHLCREFTGPRHKGQWRGALMFSLICARINGWVNNGEAGDLGRHRPHYDVIVMGMVLFVPYVIMENTCTLEYLTRVYFSSPDSATQMYTILLISHGLCRFETDEVMCGGVWGRCRRHNNCGLRLGPRVQSWFLA